MVKKAIIIGATSGIGRALALKMARQGYVLGMTGRREALLSSLQQSISSDTYTCVMDIAKPYDAAEKLGQLIDNMEGVDTVIINSGTGHCDPEFPLRGELDTVDVNVTGFTAIANAAYRYFAKQGHGHIAATSSIMALRGGPCPAYNASKAYMSNYLEGLCCRAHKTGVNITVTDIRPGFVDTQMAKGDGIFWLASVEKAAVQILCAVEQKKRVVYITKRWRLIAILMQVLPFRAFVRLMLGKSVKRN